MQRVDGVAALQPLEHFRLLLRAGVTEAEADQETVQLGFRQGERALVVDGVLGGDDHERRLERVALAVHGDTLLGHRFQQGGLGPRRGPVDFIGQHRLGKDRAGPELEISRLLVEDRDAGHVGGQ